MKKRPLTYYEDWRCRPQHWVNLDWHCDERSGHSLPVEVKVRDWCMATWWAVSSLSGIQKLTYCHDDRMSTGEVCSNECYVLSVEISATRCVSICEANDVTNQKPTCYHCQDDKWDGVSLWSWQCIWRPTVCWHQTWAPHYEQWIKLGSYFILKIWYDEWMRQSETASWEVDLPRCVGTTLIRGLYAKANRPSPPLLGGPGLEAESKMS